MIALAVLAASIACVLLALRGPGPEQIEPDAARYMEAQEDRAW